MAGMREVLFSYVALLYAWIVIEGTVISYVALFCWQVVIEGTVGVSYRGDIAIDDVAMSDGSCTG